MRKTSSVEVNLRRRQFAILLLASAIGIPSLAQNAQQSGAPDTDVAVPAQSVENTQSSPPSDTQEPPVPYTASPVKPPKEGFWGRLNPFARKKWVKNQLTPINDQLSELNEVNDRNARDIKDVDSRAQAGISKAQSTADTANETAVAAGTKAQQASSTAQSAMNHVDGLTTTVKSLDNYNQMAEVEVDFRGGQPALSAKARQRLDDLAAKVSGQQGYILEVEAHSPARGAAGIQNSERLAEAVKRYLVTEHAIPVYRMHSVALGNARGVTGEDGEKPVQISSVHIRLMENSLAAQGTASPQNADNLTGAERP